MADKSPRRNFVKTIVAAGAAGHEVSIGAQQTRRVSGFDHVALPMQDTDAMLAFYRRLGFDVRESASAASLKAMLERANAKIEVGPVDRGGGRQKTGSSVYVRDPDGNLLEFMIYA